MAAVAWRCTTCDREIDTEQGVLMRIVTVWEGLTPTSHFEYYCPPCAERLYEHRVTRGY